jgi:hypothetical protein
MIKSSEREFTGMRYRAWRDAILLNVRSSADPGVDLPPGYGVAGHRSPGSAWRLVAISNLVGEGVGGYACRGPTATRPRIVVSIRPVA